jgi:mannose-6-phosphate isomerase-like protein (cupin superfamily)
LGCTGTTTTRVLQVRETLSSHVHLDVDEVVYVVAGDGALISEHRSVPIGPGSLAVIPRGVPHSIERRKKNPLILLSTLSGAPCTADADASK